MFKGKCIPSFQGYHKWISTTTVLARSLNSIWNLFHIAIGGAVIFCKIVNLSILHSVQHSNWQSVGKKKKESPKFFFFLHSITFVTFYIYMMTGFSPQLWELLFGIAPLSPSDLVGQLVTCTSSFQIFNDRFTIFQACLKTVTRSYVHWMGFCLFQTSY